MHKNRSTKNDKGIFGGLRSVGGKDFNRRFIQVVESNRTIVYGEKPDKPEKRIPMQTVSKIRLLTKEQMKSEGAPTAFLEFGWALTTEDKEIIWAAESADARDSWMNFLTLALDVMLGRVPTSDVSGPLAPQPTQLASMMEEAERAAVAARRAKEEAAQQAKRDDSEKKAAGGDDDDDEGGTAGKSQRELKDLVGGEDDDFLDFDDALNADDDDDDDDLSDQDFDDDDDGTGSQRGGRSGGSAAFNKELVYQNFLTLRANEVYDHIGFKRDLYKDQFRPGDYQGIRFSRTVDKIGKKENIQVRDLFISQKTLYMCHKGMLGSASVRAIDLDQLVGVIESSVDPTLFAIIIPSFHDILIRISQQKSPIPSSEQEVKHQLIAHLFAGQRKLVDNRPFILREAPDVRILIRRSEDDSHLPLGLKGPYSDHLRLANNERIYTAIRTNADSMLYYSVMVQRVNAKREQQTRALAVTDSAVYICSDSVDKVQKRVPLASIKRLLYDSDMNAILMQCHDVDVMVTVRSEADFKNIRNCIVLVCKESLGYDLKASPSHSLYSVARLIDQKTIAQHLGGLAGDTGDGLKSAARLTQKIMKNAARLTAKGMTTVASGVVNAGMSTVDVVKSGVNVVGGVVVDNALMGGMIDVMGAAGGKIMGQHKLLFETCLELEDEEKLMKVDELCDTLRLQTAPNAANWKLGTVYYSSRCQRFNLQSHLDSDKTADRLLVVCDKGLFLFEDPSAGKGINLNIFRSSKTLQLDESVDFHLIIGFVRCERESNVVGVQLGEGKSSDMMLRIPNMHLTDKLASHLLRKYSSHMTKQKGFLYTLPIYKSAKPDSLKAALKRNPFDPSPTIALRAHPHGDQLALSVVPDVCEMLRRHGDNHIWFSGPAWRFRNEKGQGPTKADPKVGALDDKESKKNFKSFNIVISNCALYMMTKGGYEITRRTELRLIERAILSTQDPDAVLLQVPSEYDIYCRVEGRAKELIDRLQEARAEWTEYGLYLSHETEGSHDIAKFTFPVETAADLVARGNLEKPKNFDDVQSNREASAIKTSYIKQMARTIESALAAKFDSATGMLVTPGVKGGRAGGGPSEDGGSHDAHSIAQTAMTQIDTWENEIKRNEDRIEAIRFAVRRAYRFGYRAANVRVMSLAMNEVDSFRLKKQYAEKLSAALEAEDVALYDKVWSQCKHLHGMDLFQRRQRDRLSTLRERQAIERKILTCIDYGCDDLDGAVTSSGLDMNANPTMSTFFSPSATQMNWDPESTGDDPSAKQGSDDENDSDEPNLDFDDSDDDKPAAKNPKRATPPEVEGGRTRSNTVKGGPGTPNRSRAPSKYVEDAIDPNTTIEERLPMLSSLFNSAVRSGVKPETLAQFRLRLDRRLQQYRMTVYINNLRSRGDKIDYRTKDLLREASASLDLNPRISQSIIETENPMIRWAVKLIEASIDGGNIKTLTDAMQRVKENSVSSEPEVQEMLEKGNQELKALTASQTLVEELTTLCGQLRFGLNRLPIEDLKKSLGDLQRLQKEMSVARSLNTKKALATMYIDRVNAAIAAREAEYARTEKARQERLEYENRLLQAELDQQRLLRAEQEEEERQQQHRRTEQLMLWKDKATRCRIQLDHYMRNGDVVSARIITVNCLDLSRELRDLFQNYSEKDQQHFTALVHEVLESLQETCKRASKYVETKTGSAPATTASATGAGDSPGANAAAGAQGSGAQAPEPDAVLPEDLLEAIHKQDKVRMVAYVQAHQGQLSVKTIEKIRALWRQAAVEGQWITKLHSNIHTAVALGSIEMLTQHLETAKAHKNYSDRVVRDGTILLERMRREAADRQKEAQELEASSKPASGDGKPVAGAGQGGGLNIVLIPTAQIPVMPLEAQTPGPRGQIIKELYVATADLLQEKTDVTQAKKDPTKACHSPDSRMVKNFVEAWTAVLMHRVKPVGLFKKVDRTLQEVLQIVSNACVKGVKTAPETARIIARFEQIKKYNNPKGLSASQMFMRYVFHKGQMASLLTEWAGLGLQDLDTIYFEDSVHRGGPAFLGVFLKLLQSVESQVEWAFEFVEGDDVGSSSPTAGSPSSGARASSSGGLASGMSPSGLFDSPGSSGGSPNPQRALLPPVFGNNRGQDNPIPLLRKTIHSLTEYFRKESTKLGQRYSPSELAMLFDESKNKGIGILVRENICTALQHIFLSGFKTTGLISKKHPWEFLTATAEKLKMSTRGLGGVGVPDAVEMVLSLTDASSSTSSHRRTTGTDLSKLNQEQLADIRMRMFFCHALNQHTLCTFLEAIFDSEPHNEPFMAKFYLIPKCSMLIPMHREEIVRVLRKLSSLPFTLNIDAEIW
jgi:hypothetical protein